MYVAKVQSTEKNKNISGRDRSGGAPASYLCMYSVVLMCLLYFSGLIGQMVLVTVQLELLFICGETLRHCISNFVSISTGLVCCLFLTLFGAWPHLNARQTLPNLAICHTTMKICSQSL